MLLAKGIQKAAAELGLGRVTWHGLRHSCRTWLDAQGVPVGIQKDLLRHSDISVTADAKIPIMLVGKSTTLRR
jgi:integrase